jgi:hypothetical protein
MNLHLAEIAAQIIAGAHAAILVDQAGWHLSGKLRIPSTLIPLCQPNVLNSTRKKTSCSSWAATGSPTASSNPTTTSSTSAATRLEQAQRPALENHIHRNPRLGLWVMISESWYKSQVIQPYGTRRRGHHKF